MADGGRRTRREFVQKTAIAAGMLTVFAPSIGKFGASAFAIENDALGKLRSKFGGLLIVPTDTEYEDARKVIEFNPETNRFPALVAQCKDEEDVLRCIDFAHKQELEVAVRSGNHSILGWGTCDKGMVIDLSRMKGVVVDPAKRVVKARTGNTAEEILAATAPYGLAPALGECGTVGAGLVLGGGLGWLSSTYGATCDNLLSARLITAGARSLQADNQANQDLFWAIRGGGGNFGVATLFEYRLHPVVSVLAGSLTYPVKSAGKMLRNYMRFMANAPDEMQAECYLTTGGSGSFSVEFVYTGKPEEGERLVGAFRKLDTQITDTIKRRAYSDVYKMDAENMGDPFPFERMKGMYLEALPDEMIDLILERFAQAPASCQAVFNFCHYVHGEVCRVAPDATAFDLRKKGAQTLGSWVNWREEAQKAAADLWLNTTFEKLQRYASGRIYTNYMSENGEAASRKAYGGNYMRLAQLKKKYDPENFFHLNANVQPK